MHTEANGNELNIIYQVESDNKIMDISDTTDTLQELTVTEYLPENPDNFIEFLIKENENLKLENLNLKNEINYYEDLSVMYEQRIKQLQEKVYEVK